MDFIDFSAGKDDDGRRLDRIARRFFSTGSLSSVYKAIRKGLVKVNGERTTAETHVHSGDVISVADFLLSRRTGPASPHKNETQQLPMQTHRNQMLSTNPKPSVFPHPVLFHNEHILVIDKPYGRTVHGSADSIEKDVVRLYEETASGKTSLSFRPGPLHRLDRRTSGVLVFSWSLTGAQWFSRKIAEHAVKKTYIGIAHGRLEKSEEWSDFITRKQDAACSGEFHTVSVSRSAAGSAQGKQAVTYAEPLQHGFFRGVPVTLVRYVIETGRTHQIRSQSALHRFPLFGDTAYGGAEISGAQQLFLHAYSLEIPGENPLELPPVITAPLPKAFRDFLCEADCEIQTLRL